MQHGSAVFVHLDRGSTDIDDKSVRFFGAASRCMEASGKTDSALDPGFVRIRRPAVSMSSCVFPIDRFCAVFQQLLGATAVDHADNGRSLPIEGISHAEVV